MLFTKSYTNTFKLTDPLIFDKSNLEFHCHWKINIMLEISVEAPKSPHLPPVLSSMDGSPLSLPQKRSAGKILMEYARQGMKIMPKCWPVHATPLYIQSDNPGIQH